MENEPLVTDGKARHRASRQRHALFFLAAVAIGCSAGMWVWQQPGSDTDLEPRTPRGVVVPWVKRVTPKDETAKKIVAAAHAQKGTVYNADYQVISFPGGDVDQNQGACTDVVIRALRAVGHDLQELMHQDMRKNFRLYPQKWGLAQPDKNIDHRRVPNQMKFFERFAQELTTEVDQSTLATWQPGDLVFWYMGNGRYHTGIVSDGLNPDGLPLVIHNGYICGEDDSLTRWKIIGHYRYPKRPAA